jgi:phage replication initiation protein
MGTHNPLARSGELGGERQAEAAKRPAAAAAESPRTVIRGESPLTPQAEGPQTPSGAFTDYLNVTFPIADESDPLGYFSDNFYSAAGRLFGEFEDRGRGIHGWTISFGSANGGVLFAYGGQRNTAYLSIPGEGCSLVEDWDALGVWLRDWAGGRITRWDGAVDDFDGVRPVDHAVAAYQRGEFKAGGRQPTHDMRGDWLAPMGRGRTFYVGSRRNGKLFRVYEKGKQLGKPNSLWVRHEVELHNNDRVIPWDVLWHPGKYVAGAYPYLAWVEGEGARIPTIRETATVSLQFLKFHCRRTFGPLIGTLRRHGITDSEIVDNLRRDGAPARLAVPELLGIRPGETDD